MMWRKYASTASVLDMYQSLSNTRVHAAGKEALKRETKAQRAAGFVPPARERLQGAVRPSSASLVASKTSMAVVTFAYVATRR